MDDFSRIDEKSEEEDGHGEALCPRGRGAVPVHRDVPFVTSLPPPSIWMHHPSFKTREEILLSSGSCSLSTLLVLSEYVTRNIFLFWSKLAEMKRALN